MFGQMINVQFFPCGHTCQFREETVRVNPEQIDAPILSSAECPDCKDHQDQIRRNLARYGLTEADMYENI